MNLETKSSIHLEHTAILSIHILITASSAQASGYKGLVGDRIYFCKVMKHDIQFVIHPLSRSLIIL